MPTSGSEGLFLAFQYPHAIPGVTVTSFLRPRSRGPEGARARPTRSDSEFRKEMMAAMEGPHPARARALPERRVFGV